jgi:translation initiation factor 2 subunit 2
MAALEADLPEPAAELNEEELLASFDSDLKKKKKKKKKAEDGAEAGAVVGERVYADYSYETLLQRVTDIIHAKNPELTEKKRTTMKPPNLMMIGTKKTLWVNFQDNCTSVRRSPEHVYQFFMAELGTEGNFDGMLRLVIRGRHRPKNIESLMRKYILEYVTCKMCHSPTTTMTKDSVSRLNFMHCEACSSSRSLPPIHTGFHAQTRADRKALRAVA